MSSAQSATEPDGFMNKEGYGGGALPASWTYGSVSGMMKHDLVDAHTVLDVIQTNASNDWDILLA